MLDNTDGSPSIRHHRHRKVGKVGDGQQVQPPKGYRVIRVVTDSTSELEDLASCRRDLEMAEMFATTYRDVPAAEEVDPRRPESAFWIAALTMYGRAFANGVRQARISLDDLDLEDLESHRYYIHLRNKYVAHSVNSYEGSIALAYITDSPFVRPAVTRVGQVHMESVPLSDGELLEFIGLCGRIIKGTQRRIEKIHRKVHRELRQMGQQTVYAMPDLDLDLDRRLARASVARPRGRIRLTRNANTDQSPGGEFEEQ